MLNSRCGVIVSAIALFCAIPALAQTASSASQETPLSVCQSNLYNSQLALTMWFIDHDDTYPKSLDVLVPDYFVHNLYCPLAGTTPYVYEVLDGGKAFKISCPSAHGAEGKAPSAASDSEMEAEVRAAKPD